MTQLVLKVEDQIAFRLSKLAREEYHGDQSAAVSDALLLLFMQPIPKDRRDLAKLIYEIRTQVQSAGGVIEYQIGQFIKQYRRQKNLRK